LLIIPAHALALIPAARQAGFGGSARMLARRWLVTVAAAMAVVAPVAVIGWQQRVQIAWLPRPNWYDVHLLVIWLAAGSAASVAAIGLLILLGVIRAGRPHTLTWLAVPWLVLPPAALLIASQVMPVYQVMYVEFCLPAVALLAGAGLAAAGRPLRFAGLALVVALGLPTQLAIRGPSAGGNLRGAAQILDQHKLPGDAVFYPGPTVPSWDIAYPDGFGGLRDIGLAKTAAQADALSGVPVSPRVLMQRLGDVQRLWVIEMGTSWQQPPVALKPAFRLAGTWQVGSIRMRLYTQAARSAASQLFGQV
jgi:mannosyltransferase